MDIFEYGLEIRKPYYVKVKFPNFDKCTVLYISESSS